MPNLSHCRRRITPFDLQMALFLSAIACVPLAADEPAKPTPQQTAESDRLGAEYRTLYFSPDAPADWRELLRVQSAIMDLRMASDLQAESYEEKIRRLELNEDRLIGSAGVVEWRAKLDPISRRLSDFSGARYSIPDAIEVKEFQSRHAALTVHRVATTPCLHALNLELLSYPRIDGSTSTQPLAAIIACRCFDAEYGWVGYEISYRSRSIYAPVLITLPDGRRLDPAPDPDYLISEFSVLARQDIADQERLAVILNTLLIRNASTHDAYMNLIEGRSDIGLLARRPSRDEASAAGAKGIELDVRPCALDAFVFLVHRENKVKTLTSLELRLIYSGLTTNWKEVGGKDKQITAYQREKNSGSQELFEQLLMQGKPYPKLDETNDSRQLIRYGMIGPYRAITHDADGLAYSVNYYERFMAGSPHTRTIAVDGVEPTYENIRDGKYPYVTEVFVVTRANLDPKSPTCKLRDWILTDEGQAVVRESGYVPLTKQP